MGRILAIDYGQKRSGIAVTDSLQIIVSPLCTVETSSLSAFITQYLEEEEVDCILIGYPRHKDGTKTYLCGEIDDFIEKWKDKSHIYNSFQRVDEEFSSHEAKSLLFQAQSKRSKRQEKGALDMYSAVVILRRYLNY